MRTDVARFRAGFFAAAWPWSFWRCSARSWYAVVIVIDRARTALAKLAARMAAVQGAEPEQAPRRRATRQERLLILVQMLSDMRHK